jgi:hypothetical protein
MVASSHCRETWDIGTRLFAADAEVLDRCGAEKKVAVDPSPASTIGLL